jgi:hypothetical protein
MHVNHFDALPGHAHIAMGNRSARGLCRTLAAALSTALKRLKRGVEYSVASGQDSRRHARHAHNEIPAIRHTLLLNCSIPGQAPLAKRRFAEILRWDHFVGQIFDCQAITEFRERG